MEPNSPAALAGLRPHTDYIVGSDQILQEVQAALFYKGDLGSIEPTSNNKCRGGCRYITVMSEEVGLCYANIPPLTSSSVCPIRSLFFRLAL